MSDMIDRWAAIGLIHSMYPSEPIMRINRERWEKKYKPYIEAEKALEMLPSVQSEIIHCKDCKWKNQHNCTRAVELFIDDNKYCAWAERKTDD